MFCVLLFLSAPQHLLPVSSTIRSTAVVHHPKDFSSKSGDLTEFPALCAVGKPENGWAFVPVLLQLKQRTLLLPLRGLGDLEHPNYSTPAFQPQGVVLYALFEPRLWYQAFLLAGKSESRVLRHSAPSRQPALGSKDPDCSTVWCKKDSMAIA